MFVEHQPTSETKVEVMCIVHNSTIDFFCYCSKYGLVRKITIGWIRKFPVAEIKNSIKCLFTVLISATKKCIYPK
jgi:hypothetical protein